MRISDITISNFRIYKGENHINFENKSDKSIHLVAGKNGFGKTTFLTSLIWGLYGKQMSQVEDKYKIDIRHVGGYDKYLGSLLNRDLKREFDNKQIDRAEFFVELKLEDILIPSIPCKEVVIKRSYSYFKNKETLSILIDGQENELTKEVGYEVFINDFILPREIAKFFFFDAEKVVTLAEAKSVSELRSLSKAYSEVLGIKKYEDLKQSLNIILSKLRRSGATELDQEKLDQLVQKEGDLKRLIELNENKQLEIEEDLTGLRLRIDHIQEQLIREGNSMTLGELKVLKDERDALKKDLEGAKVELKKLMDIVPLVIAGPRLGELIQQLKKESKIKQKSVDQNLLKKELDSFSKELKNEIEDIGLAKGQLSKIESALKKLIVARGSNNEVINGDILLDFDEATTRSILATYDYIKNSFKSQFEQIIKNEKDVRQHLGRVNRKIKLGEVRKNNPIAKQLREDKVELSQKLEQLFSKKGGLIEELNRLKQQHASIQKVLSEEEKKFKVVGNDQKKYEVTLILLEKLKILTARIKEEKKYALQNSILMGLNKLMHKNKFVSKVNVRIEDEVMDIDLIDQHNQIINKETLSKGEQQLYATALLKALVDQSGIDFPVFIDSPLQKFDKEHSSNVIQQFYPSISDQVVLFPLLEKELTKKEYELLTPHLGGVYLIENKAQGSTVQKQPIKELFNQFNKQHVLTH
ncbi:DNA sulfur modification protein DndD [uncultured Psychroserpens sp.]|uniref:DNA sulfur modification protein DndD n=1 Tax=uncultured Psychroserpens sp. TaxID=255436 RepID=UPI0026080E25|nr:DNA sulfur modification protein DndD [uncultured Psychroserpens sp.]